MSTRKSNRDKLVGHVTEKKQPWAPGDATLTINSIAKDENHSLSYTYHAKTRLLERGLIMSDLLYVLKNCMVYDAPTSDDVSSIAGRYKYKIECQTPNSESRTVRVIVIPDQKSREMKVITIMWRDES